VNNVLVANKMDLADKAATKLFDRWADGSHPRKAVVAQTVQGQLDVAWLDLIRNPERRASFPDAHQAGFIQAYADRGATSPKAPSFGSRPWRMTRKSALANSSLQNAADGYQSFGTVFPEHSCFDYEHLEGLLSQLEAERIKAVFSTNKGWFIFNAVDGVMAIVPCKPSANSWIEIVATQNNWPDISAVLNQCVVNGCSDSD